MCCMNIILIKKDEKIQSYPEKILAFLTTLSTS